MSPLPSTRTPLGRLRTVLCGIDFSEHSRRALRSAWLVARRAGADLCVVYVNDPLIVAAAEVGFEDRQWVARSGGELAAFVAQAIGPRERTVRVHTVAAIGDPAEQLMAQARRTRAGLIVVGTHGLTGTRRVIGGSTALGLLQHTRVPVLVVPLQRGAARQPLARRWPGGAIVAAIDLASGTRQQVEVAAAVARQWDAPLLLVHVVDTHRVAVWAAAARREHERHLIAHARARLETLATIARRTTPTEVRVLCGNAADEIAALAVSERSGLVMTALRDRHRWFGAARGSVSYHVLAQAVAPVLAYPPRWRGWPREGRR